MPEATPRSARLEVSIASDTLQLVERAAEIEDRSLSEYVNTALDAAARHTIEETYLIRLSVEGQRRFAELLIQSPEPSPGMLKALQKHHLLTGERRP